MCLSFFLPSSLLLVGLFLVFWLASEGGLLSAGMYLILRSILGFLLFCFADGILSVFLSVFFPSLSLTLKQSLYSVL